MDFFNKYRKDGIGLHSFVDNVDKFEQFHNTIYSFDVHKRMNLVNTIDPFVGKYFSIDYVRRQVLKQTDVEIKEIDKQIEEEMAEGKIIDPAEEAMMAAAGGGMDPAAGGAPAQEQKP